MLLVAYRNMFFLTSAILLSLAKTDITRGYFGLYDAVAARWYTTGSGEAAPPLPCTEVTAVPTRYHSWDLCRARRSPRGRACGKSSRPRIAVRP
jgi:hypothetical protein